MRDYTIRRSRERTIGHLYDMESLSEAVELLNREAREREEPLMLFEGGTRLGVSDQMGNFHADRVIR